ncbi:ubiquinol oxidase subunit II [Rhizobium sp. SIMBA_035]
MAKRLISKCFVLKTSPILAAASLSSSCSGVLAPIGPVGEGNAQILINGTVIMLAIVIPTIVLAFWIAWRYRASNASVEYLPYWSFSGRIEAVVWSIPILTIMVIGGLIWTGSYKLDPFRPLDSDKPQLEIQVVALDWKWLFIYPEQGIATVNQLVVPVGTPVHFRLTSASVFNVFWVPRLGSMVYAMPGMVSELHLQADSAADIWGTSAQFSGDGFSDMQFKLRSLADADFTSWIDSARGVGKNLDQTAYARLARQSQRDPPSAFTVSDPHLFDAIATQKVSPGPGPQAEGPEHAGREHSTGGKD